MILFIQFDKNTQTFTEKPIENNVPSGKNVWVWMFWNVDKYNRIGFSAASLITQAVSDPDGQRNVLSRNILAAERTVTSCWGKLKSSQLN